MSGNGAQVVAAEGLRVENLSVRYALASGLFQRGRQLAALTDVSFDIRPGETLGIVGESGCGKSTLARALVRLAPVSEGRIWWNGVELTRLDDAAFRKLRPEIQMVFQDPFAALNPRMRMFDILAEPLLSHPPGMNRTELRRRVFATIKLVGLRTDMAMRFPHEFSGGQAQRIAIGRAIISRPKLLICDEAVAALDVSVQALILSLLQRLQARLGLSMIFISHDLAVVRQLSHRILVLYLGRVCEDADRHQLFAETRHPYTQALIGAVLSSDPDVERARNRLTFSAELPPPLAPPSGCPFRNRCPRAEARCAAETPMIRTVAPGHRAACHFV